MRLEVSLFVFLITGQVLRLSIQRGLREFFRFSKGASFPEMIREHLKPDPGSSIIKKLNKKVMHYDRVSKFSSKACSFLNCFYRSVRNKQPIQRSEEAL